LSYLSISWSAILAT